MFVEILDGVCSRKTNVPTLAWLRVCQTGLNQLISQYLHCHGQIERTVEFTGRDIDVKVAFLQLLVFEAMCLPPKNQGNFITACLRLKDLLCTGPRVKSRPGNAPVSGRSADNQVTTLERLIEVFNNSGVLDHIIGTGRAPDRLVVGK